jgi:hypothetical protein
MLTEDARCISEIKSRIAIAKAAFNQNNNLNLRRKLVKCYIWSTALHGTENRILRIVDQNYLEGSEMWSWRKMETNRRTYCVRNDEILY